MEIIIIIIIIIITIIITIIIIKRTQFASPEKRSRFPLKPDRLYINNVQSRRVRATIITVGKQ
jgi:hypothetical protein